jgi:hypothetical protein
VYGGAEVPVLSPPEGQPAASGDGYELNFENTPVAIVAKVVLGDIMGVGYSIDPRIQGTISLSSGRPVPRSDMLFVLENALRLSGVALLKDVAGYRLVPLGDAVGAGNLDQTAGHVEPGYGVSVVPLRHVSAATLLKLLDSFATRPGIVRADASRNLLLIQGSGPERRSAIETALSFDVDWMRGQSVGIFPVQNSNPEPVIAELEKIMDSGEGGLSHNVVKFLPVARMNAILVVTRKQEFLKTAANWISRLDNADTTRTGVHVYHVKFGEARQLARVLSEIFVGGSGSSSTLDQPANQIAPGSGLASTTSGDRSSSYGTNQQAPSSGFGARSTGSGGSDTRNGFGATQSTLGTDQNAMADGRNGLGTGPTGPAALPGVRITADIVHNASLLVTRTVDTGPGGENDPNRTLASIVAAADAAEPHAKLPSNPKPLPPAAVPWVGNVTPVRVRKLYFSEHLDDPNNPSSASGFYLTVDGQTPAPFDPAASVPDIVVKQGDVEDWIIENRSMELHDFHIHQLHFQLLEWSGIRVNEPFLRDTVNVPYYNNRMLQYPSVRLRMDFRDPNIVGTFVYHCHVLEHEDGGMMGRIQVEPADAVTSTESSSQLIRGERYDAP